MPTENRCAPPIFQSFDPFTCHSFRVFIPQEPETVSIPSIEEFAQDYKSYENSITKRFGSKLAPNIGKLLPCPVCRELMKRYEIRQYKSESIWKYICNNKECPRYNIA